MYLKASITTQRIVLQQWIAVVEWIIKATTPFQPPDAQKTLPWPGKCALAT